MRFIIWFSSWPDPAKRLGWLSSSLTPVKDETGRRFPRHTYPKRVTELDLLVFRLCTQDDERACVGALEMPILEDLAHGEANGILRQSRGGWFEFGDNVAIA